MTDDVRRAIDAVWRIESARVIAAVARYTSDIALAASCLHGFNAPVADANGQ